MELKNVDLAIACRDSVFRPGHVDYRVDVSADV
jgi:hypothetical protein